MKSFQGRILSAAALLAALVTSAPATAQEGFQVDQFEPLHAQGINTLNIARSEVLGHLAPSAGLFVHYQDDPMQVETQDGEIEARLVDHQLKVEVIGGIGLLDWVDVGLAVPVVLAQSGEGSSFVGVDSFSGVAVSDLRLTPKVRLLRHEDFGGLGAALQVATYIPTGATTSFNSDGTVRVEPRLAVDFNTDFLVLAANLGVHLRPERQANNYVSGNAFRYGLGAQVPIVGDLSAIGSYYGSIGLQAGRSPDDASEVAANTQARPMELLFGGQYDLPMSLVAQAGAGFGLTSSVGTPDFRLFASIGYTPRSADSDEDGIPDSRDECPQTPEDRDRFEDADGCPDPDNDGDGILDADDQCPMKAEDQDGFEDADGCPDPDNDGDGVLDGDDGCPDTPGDLQNEGCPRIDSDRDGLFDPQDECPEDPEDKDGFEDEDGCPDADNDQDGVLDADDRCPMEKEVINGVDDEDGCPDEGESKVRVTETKIEILEKVFFDTNKATIKPVSYDVLNQVASVLKANPQITGVRVEGHTDSRGAEDYNQELSQKRAEAVRDYLVERGVGTSRLIPKGYGETRPIADNETEQGRDDNRRVEFNIVEIDGMPVEEGEDAVIEKEVTE